MSNEQPKKEFKPLPEGDYLMILEKFEEKATRKGDGVMLNAVYQVVTPGENKGKKVFANYLVEHPSEKAVEIATNKINSFLKAVGVENGLDDLGHDRTRLEDFTNEKFVATLGIKEAEEYTDYQGNQKVSKPRNIIKKYSAR